MTLTAPFNRREVLVLFVQLNAACREKFERAGIFDFVVGGGEIEFARISDALSYLHHDGRIRNTSGSFSSERHAEAPEPSQTTTAARDVMNRSERRLSGLV